MADFKKIFEDLASGRPAKKPVSSNLLKQRARENQKALDTGFMKLTPKERAKESKRMSEEKIGNFKDGSYYGKPSPRLKKKVKGAKEVVNNPHSKDDGKTVVPKQKQYNPPMSKSKQGVNNVLKFLKKNPDYKIGAHSLKKESTDMCSCDCNCGKAICESCGKPKMQKESTRDNYNPVTSAKVTKEKLKKVGLPTEPPIVKEAKKPIVHFKGKDSLKTVKIKYNKPIKTKVTDIGAGGKEYVRKDWSEETFKPHDMWSPKGEKKFAKTEKEHLALKDKGWGHNNPNKSEEKKKGLDGKACWDGYKQMGTKKKGGKTVDNCVKMKEEQIQLVTNLDFNESLGNLVTRGMDKVRGAIKDAEKRTGYKVDPSKNNHSNPVSGKNIAKRLASQKKR